MISFVPYYMQEARIIFYTRSANVQIYISFYAYT